MFIYSVQLLLYLDLQFLVKLFSQVTQVSFILPYFPFHYGCIINT